MARRSDYLLVVLLFVPNALATQGPSAKAQELGRKLEAQLRRASTDKRANRAVKETQNAIIALGLDGAKELLSLAEQGQSPGALESLTIAGMPDYAWQFCLAELKSTKNKWRQAACFNVLTEARRCGDRPESDGRHVRMKIETVKEIVGLAAEKYQSNSEVLRNFAGHCLAAYGKYGLPVLLKAKNRFKGRDREDWLFDVEQAKANSRYIFEGESP